MRSLMVLAASSLWSRRSSASLVVLSIALSVVLLLGIERLRDQARVSFTSTISGVDLVVGARTGPINLLLYTVFRLGNPTANVSWQAYQQIAALPEVAWAVPLSLGDSHLGYPVVATQAEYFRYYRHGDDQSLRLREGVLFEDLFDVVVGADVAHRLGYRPGDALVLAHGAGQVALTRHDNLPFRVSGILAPTGTPVDTSLHISLAAFEALHQGWRGGIRLPGLAGDASRLRERVLVPRQITGFLLGLHSRTAVFALQRQINTWSQEPLLAILPGLTLHQLWDLIAVAENALQVVSWLVLLVALTALVTAMLTGLNERRREMAILRAVGAGPQHIFLLVLGECLLLGGLGIVLGVALLHGIGLLVAPWLAATLGMPVSFWPPSAGEYWLLLMVLAGSVIAGLWPAWRASRRALMDGLVSRY